MAKAHNSLTDRFAANFGAERAKRKLSQAAFGGLVELTPAYVHMLEHAERSPSLTMIDHIAARLEIADPVTLLKEVK